MAYTSIFKGSLVDDRVGAIKDGGTTGQVLTKSSNSDYDTSWQTPAGGGSQTGSFTFIPADASGVPNLTLFVDVADSLLKFKDNTGTIYEVGLGVI